MANIFPFKKTGVAISSSGDGSLCSFRYGPHHQVSQRLDATPVVFWVSNFLPIRNCLVIACNSHVTVVYPASRV